MNKKVTYLFIALFFSFCNNLFSQEKNVLGPNEFFTMHYYTFEGNGAQDKLDAMEQSLSSIDMVSEAKVKFKSEKNMGQIVLVVKEKTITSEGDKSFSPTSIKQTILKSGFTPMEYSVGKYERK
jgi:hypothetical protein